MAKIVRVKKMYRQVVCFLLLGAFSGVACDYSERFERTFDITGQGFQGTANVFSGDETTIDTDPGPNGDDQDPHGPADTDDQSCGPDATGFLLYADSDCDGFPDNENQTIERIGVISHDKEVTDFNDTEKCGVIRVRESGVYQLFDHLGDTGPCQRNESGYILIIDNATDPENSTNPPVSYTHLTLPTN